jgi:PAS domain-containing protein
VDTPELRAALDLLEPYIQPAWLIPQFRNNLDGEREKDYSGREGRQHMANRFQKLMEQSPDAILIDVGGRIVYINNATVRLFGAASPAEMLGRWRLEFIHPNCHAAVKERIKKLIHSAKPVAALDEK